ncbi:SET domain-containing protein [Hypomontagnella monticulosa]|nr:SET domain-containing protein [Hypomontagnella monticulosa]
MRTTLLFSYLALLGAVSGAADICPWSPLQEVEPQTCPRAYLIGDPLAATWRRLHDPIQLAWKGPENCVNDTCIFYNKRMGDGIVLLTTERNAEIISSFPVKANSGETERFRVTEVPGKGIGVVATRKIKKGETILVRSPTMMGQTAAYIGMEKGTREVLYDIAIGKLPSKGRELFMGQMGKDVHEKINTNCFQLYVDGANESGSHLGCYPEISRFNHDCRPNVHYRINDITHTSVAARDIAPGEELSISYIELMLPREERLERLRKWGFECSCSHCTMSDEKAAESDARLKRIEELETALENFNETIVTADTGAQVAELYEQEKLDIYLGQVYTRAALNYALFGEEEKARKYAKAAVEAVERESGPDAGDARAMRILAENPKAHWTWGKRRKGEPGSETSDKEQ